MTTVTPHKSEAGDLTIRVSGDLSGPDDSAVRAREVVRRAAGHDRDLVIENSARYDIAVKITGRSLLTFDHHFAGAIASKVVNDLSKIYPNRHLTCIMQFGDVILAQVEKQ